MCWTEAMLKVVSLARRPPGIDHDEFVGSWSEVVAGTIVAEMEPDRLVLTFFDQRAGTGPHLYDAMAQVGFVDADRGRRAVGPATAGGRDRLGDLLDEVVRLVTDEHVLFDRGPLTDGARKLTFLVVARADTPHEAVVSHWVAVHGPAVAAPMQGIAGALRYVASPSIERVGGYDGVTELWYADGAASKAHAAVLGDDGFTRLADNSIFLTGRERVVR